MIKNTFFRFFLLTAALLLPLKTAQAERNLMLEQNTAEIIHLDRDVSEIFVANPDIADVQLHGSNIAYVFAKVPGTTTIFSTNSKGENTLNLSLNVVHNLKRLNHVVKSIFPNENVRAYSTPSGIVLTGSVSSARAVKDIENIASRFIKDKESIVNNMKVTSPNQVYLKVKIAEVSRTVLNRLNINWDAAFSAKNFNFGVLTGRTPFENGSFSRSGETPPFSSIGGRFTDGTSTFTTLIDALDSEGLASILAEPNLIASSGETASFLVGGEVPFPVPQDQNITIEFKEFGVSLAFTPTVLSTELIHLHVRPEVSELDDSRAIPVNLGAGTVNVPALTTRRAETSVELGSGQSLAIAGLFSNNISNAIKEFPGLGSIPILGALFSSTEFRRKTTELVIIITPFVVKPTSEERLSAPTDGLKYASHVETIFLKKLNRANVIKGENGGDSPIGLMGQAGFQLD